MTRRRWTAWAAGLIAGGTALTWAGHYLAIESGQRAEWIDEVLREHQGDIPDGPAFFAGLAMLEGCCLLAAPLQLLGIGAAAYYVLTSRRPMAGVYPITSRTLAAGGSALSGLTLFGGSVMIGLTIRAAGDFLFTAGWTVLFVAQLQDWRRMACLIGRVGQP